MLLECAGVLFRRAGRVPGDVDGVLSYANGTARPSGWTRPGEGPAGAGVLRASRQQLQESEGWAVTSDTSGMFNFRDLGLRDLELRPPLDSSPADASSTPRPAHRAAPDSRREHQGLELKPEKRRLGYRQT